MPLSAPAAYSGHPDGCRCRSWSSCRNNVPSCVWKFSKVFLSEFGGKDKTEKQKKSGNMGFEEFPRPLNKAKGGRNTLKNCKSAESGLQMHSLRMSMGIH